MMQNGRQFELSDIPGVSHAHTRAHTHTHTTGEQKARRPEGITQPSMAGARPALQE